MSEAMVGLDDVMKAALEFPYLDRLVFYVG